MQRWFDQIIYYSFFAPHTLCMQLCNILQLLKKKKNTSKIIAKSSKILSYELVNTWIDIFQRYIVKKFSTVE